MKRILTAVAILLAGAIGHSVWAQGYTVKGVVVDDQGPVIGANVMVPGTTVGTATGLDGDFILTVASPETEVEFSCIGYATQVFKASDVPERVVLMMDTEFLDDVVVIGYGTVKKNDMTGSITAIKPEEINRGAIVSTQDMLKGKVAGLQVVPGDGQPGGGSSMRIRGQASLNASNAPLIVIDGVPIAADAAKGMSNPLGSINPNDIESFTVLKDASSAAIYGSRASNGVIIITTKKGSGNRPQVSYNGSFSVSHNSGTIPVMNADEFRDFISETFPAGTANGDAAAAKLGEYNTDWYKQIFRVALAHDHNVSVYGNLKDFLPYRFSVGFTGQQGTLRTSDFGKVTADLSLNPSFLQKHLTVNLNAKGVYSYQRWAEGGAVGTATFYNPTMPVYFYDDEGDIDYDTTNGWFNYGNGRGTKFVAGGLAPENPVSMLEENVNKGQIGRFIGNIQVDYKIHGFEDLRLNVNAGMDYSYAAGKNGPNPGSWNAMKDTENPWYGQFSDWMNERRSMVFEAYANYNKEVGIHHIDAMLGYSYEKTYSKDRSINYFNRKGGETEVKLKDGETVDSRYLPNEQQFVLLSFYGRINYSIASRYLLTVTLRDDQSSRFSKKNRHGLFPSAALAWNIKEEKFLKGVDAVSALKLRASWGMTGQQEIGANYGYLSRYYFSVNPYSRYNMGTDGYLDYVTPGAYDPDIKWETSMTWNFGLDWGFIRDRINGTVDVYRRDTKDLLNSVITPMGANFGNSLLTNIGSIRNQGVEFTINAIPIETRDMSLSLGFNGTFQKTWFTKLNSGDDKDYFIETGGIAGGTGNTIQRHMVGYAPNTFYAFKQLYDASGKPIQDGLLDIDNDGVITNADRYMTKKSPSPDFFYGLNLKFSYKRWDFGLNGHGSVGNWVFNNIRAGNSTANQTFSNININNYLRSVKEYGFVKPNSVQQFASDLFLENASFFRLDDINVGYTFPELGAWKNANLRLALSVQNVFVITGYKGLDPELDGGIDNSIWPRPRTYSLRLNLNF
ncbi:MAG: TonB-dependent receptor [Bacteroidales bacterium]|nr:TonB-dependent receptor [Bacteroidales bacterium]